MEDANNMPRFTTPYEVVSIRLFFFLQHTDLVKYLVVVAKWLIEFKDRRQLLLQDAANNDMGSFYFFLFLGQPWSMRSKECLFALATIVEHKSAACALLSQENFQFQ